MMRIVLTPVGRRLSFLVLAVLLMFGLVTTATAAAIRPGFASNTLAANDDGSTGLVDLGFVLSFFGSQFSTTYVNNNGNVTFDSALSTFTPFGLLNADRIIIAPFFADVDTRVQGSSPVTYGPGLVAERPAFGVNWLNVGCFSTVAGGFNSFQLVLVDRSDIGNGDFDIEFNYQKIDWESGTASGGNDVCRDGSSARVGYSNGISTSFELDGSGIPGAFLDSNLLTGLIYNSRNSVEPGRYVFEVRNGTAPTGHRIAGTIYENDTSNPLVSALVQICRDDTTDTVCNLTRSNALGRYALVGLPNGRYTIKAFAPSTSNALPWTLAPVDLAGVDLDGKDIILKGPQPLPASTSLAPSRVGGSGLPIVYWRDTLTLATRGCPGGAASFTVVDNSTNATIATGTLDEVSGSPGSYSGAVAPLVPNVGQATVTIHVACADGTSQDLAFTVYIDPSGRVIDTDGNPLVGAKVTLFRSDSSAGPFESVADGSDIMSPVNRNNSDIADARGLFGWDVVSGYYVVRAEAEGCVSPSDSELNYVESSILTIPPAVTNLELVLRCQRPQAHVCDVNGDGSVSRSDLRALSNRLRQSVPAGTEGDVNLDGKITSLDLRGCALKCSAPNCTETES